MQISTALQEAALKEIIQEKIPVTAFLMNGFQLKGTLLDHDDAVAVLETDGRQQIVYKHVISTITPTRALKSLKG